MYKGMDSYCGLSCEECEYREEFHCGGCMATGGNPFYGPCELAACARRKKVNFCGECKDFPCDTIITKPHSSVLDKDWLTWKKKSESNR